MSLTCCFITVRSRSAPISPIVAQIDETDESARAARASACAQPLFRTSNIFRVPHRALPGRLVARPAAQALGFSLLHVGIATSGLRRYASRRTLSRIARFLGGSDITDRGSDRDSDR
jgi:hypothetical protein